MGGRGRRFRRQLSDEILDHAIGIEADFLSVCANERAGEDPAGQPRQVAALQRFERHHGNAGAVRDLPKRNTPLFARFAEACTNSSGWGTLGHHQCVAVNVREPPRKCQTPAADRSPMCEGDACEIRRSEG